MLDESQTYNNPNNPLLEGCNFIFVLRDLTTQEWDSFS